MKSLAQFVGFPYEDEHPDQMPEPDRRRPLLLTARQAADLCGTSERTWRTWDSAGRIPKPVNIGRSKFWRPKEIEAWVRHGCPDRRTWSAISEEMEF